MKEINFTEIDIKIAAAKAKAVKSKFETLTWKDIIKIEPRLNNLLWIAEHINNPENICLVRIWYHYLKPFLSMLVGWRADQDGIIRSTYAYDIAYRKIYDAMGGCNCEGCNN